MLLSCLSVLASGLFFQKAASAASHITPATRDIYEFPNETWVENFAVRSNGDLLVSILTRPQLQLVNPFTQQAVLVHTFPNVTSLAGIAEFAPDQFAVLAGTLDLTTFEPTNGSWGVWTVDMRSFALENDTVIAPARVSKVTVLAATSLPNGMTLLNEADGTILVGDLLLGQVWRVDVKTGAHVITIQDPTMGHAGVNGLQVREEWLYYTNSGLETLNRIPIAKNGSAAGAAEVLVTGHMNDDLAIDRVGDVFVAGGASNIIFEYSGRGLVTTVLGAANSSVVAGPTSARFGRTKKDRDVLYVSTSGGVLNPVGSIVGGKLVAFGPLWY